MLPESCDMAAGKVDEWEPGLGLDFRQYSDGKYTGRIFSADFENNEIELALGDGFVWRGSSQGFLAKWKAISPPKEEIMELRECPFCGGEAHIIGSERALWRAECKGRNGRCCAIHYKEQQMAADAWNRRPTEDRLRARVERLEREIKRFEEWR